MTIDLEYARQVGIGAACKGADVLRSYFGRMFEIRKKGARDLVTEADTTAEQAIINVLHYRFPEHDILAEESGHQLNRSRFCWIIDPLDGTTNFAHGIGIFAVSIALAEEGEVVAGVVLNPVTGELFTAVKGKAAELNGRAISVSSIRSIQDALLVTGFPYNHQNNKLRLTTRFLNCLDVAQGVRRLGSAALDLCYVACGRFDGFWEENLQPWDTAAGMVIARQAGAMVTDYSDRPFVPENKELLATNGHIHYDLLDLLTI